MLVDPPGCDPFDPAQNVDAGVRHLKQLMENYGGDVKMTLAAYNAGEQALEDALRNARRRGGSYLNYLPKETRDYVDMMRS